MDISWSLAKVAVFFYYLDLDLFGKIIVRKLFTNMMDVE